LPEITTRRKFLWTTAAAGLGVACGQPSFAQQAPQKFKIGMAATTWLTLSGTPATYWQAANAIGKLGIGATEADNSGVRLDRAYGKDPAAFRRMSQASQVRLMGVYQSLLLHETSLPVMLAQIRADGHFLKAVQAQYVALGWDIASPVGGKPYQRTAQDLRRAIVAANEIGRVLLNEYGLITAFHAERDASQQMAEGLLDATDPRYVHFCADVGHLAAMGFDPVAMVRKYASRLAVSHWKDFSPSLPSPGYLGDGAKGDFIEVGHGVVDFKSLASLYREIGLQGWVMLELDRTRQPDVLTSARQMKTYVTDVLRLKFYPPS
jgi:sugar phosphate isomerase/epimerase